MLIPVRLYRKASGEICETLAPGESAQLLVSQGVTLPDVEAKRLGITDYLHRRRRPPVPEPLIATKAVDKVEVEDKAVPQVEVEDKGVLLQDRSRARR